MRYLPFSLLLMFLAASPTVFAQSASAISTGKIIVTQVESPIFSALSADEEAMVRLSVIGRVFERSQPNLMAEKIREALQEFGYFKVQVAAPAMEIPPDISEAGRVLVRFNATLGIRYRLTELNWAGVKQLSLEQLRRLMPMQPGDTYDVGKVRVMLDAIARLYRSAGYQHITVRPESQADDSTGAVRLTFHVDEGTKVPVSPDDLAARPDQQPPAR